MKLILCPECGDVIKLSRNRTRWCNCRQSYGRYDLDGKHAWYAGRAIPLGIDNNSLGKAIASDKKHPRVDAFVFRPDVETFKRKLDEDSRMD